MNYHKEPLTGPKEMKKLASSLMTALLSSELDTFVELKKTGGGVYADVAFFGDGDNFSFSLYDFWTPERNRHIAAKAKELMKHPEKYEEFKAKRQEIEDGKF
jgi:hypothetical protein